MQKELLPEIHNVTLEGVRRHIEQDNRPVVVVVLSSDLPGPIETLKKAAAQTFNGSACNITWLSTRDANVTDTFGLPVGDTIGLCFPSRDTQHPKTFSVPASAHALSCVLAQYVPAGPSGPH